MRTFVGEPTGKPGRLASTRIQNATWALGDSNSFLGGTYHPGQLSCGRATRQGPREDENDQKPCARLPLATPGIVVFGWAS
eukprot:7194727-Pyramimonas_sp.AAC.1